jgi:hypothetical protein
MDHTLHITGDDAADELLSTSPLALLVGMLLDQQVAMETAFSGPKKIQDRVGRLDAATLAHLDPERLTEVFRTLLGKQAGLRADGWREAAGAYGEEGCHRSVADIVDAESLARVRETKRAAKAAAKAQKG